MSGNRDDIEHTPAAIERPDIRGPFGDSRRLLNLFWRGRHKLDARQRLEAFVPEVAVFVRVNQLGPPEIGTCFIVQIS